MKCFSSCVPVAPDSQLCSDISKSMQPKISIISKSFLFFIFSSTCYIPQTPWVYGKHRYRGYVTLRHALKK